MKLKKKIELFAFLSVIILLAFPVENVFGVLGNENTLTSGGLTNQGFGHYGNNNDFPSGTLATPSGIYMAYTQWVVVNQESSLIFQKVTGVDEFDNSVFTSQVIVDATALGFGYRFVDIEVFASGTTIDIVAGQEIGGSVIELSHYRSTDDGATWSSPNLIATTLSYNSIWFDVVGNNVGVLLHQQSGELEFTKSSNGGTSFSTTVIDDNTNSTNANAETIGDVTFVQDSNGSDIWVVFTGDDKLSPHDDEIFITHSSDGGTSFPVAQIVSGLVTPFELRPTIFVDGTDVTVIYAGAGGAPPPEIYMSQVRSSDSGDTFSAQEDIFLGTTCDWNFASGQSTQLAQDGSTIHVICGEASNSGDIFTAKTTNMGASWTSLVPIYDIVGDAVNNPIHIAVVGNDVFYSWKGLLAVPSNSFMVYKTSSDGGSTFSTEQHLVRNSDGESGSATHLRASSGFAFMGWTDTSTANLEIATESTNDIPVITLTGSATVQLNLNDLYLELGATCLDPEDGSIVVSIGGDVVDTSTANIYTVTYDCQDSGGLDAVQVSRTVEVSNNPAVQLFHVDVLCLNEEVTGLSATLEFLNVCPITGADPPVITITGSTIIEVALGDDYTELGATAIDTLDGDVTSNIVIGGDVVDMDTVGAYLVTYNVVDSAGNNAVEKIRSVIVASVGTTGGGGTGGGGLGGDPVGSPPDEGTGIEGFTDEQQLAFEEALANAIASIDPTEGNLVESFIQTFFEFTVVDKVHEELALQSFLDDERLGIRWSTGADIVVVNAIPAPSPFSFDFEQFPTIKRGSGAFVSTDFVLYNLNVPRNECSDVISSDCVEKIRYEIPITINAVIDGVQVTDTGTITVDLTEEDIDFILLLVVITGAIPIVGVMVARLRGKSTNVPIRRIFTS